MHTIRLFMWGYQRHFQISVKNRAKELFRALNPEFETDVFLLGVRRSDDLQKHPVCLEPEDCGFEPEDFASIREDAEHRYAVDPERNIMGMIQSHHNSLQRGVRIRAMAAAVLEILNGWRQREPGEYHFSGFLPVGDYDVAVVLCLKCSSVEMPYRLPRVHADSRYGAPDSFLSSVIEEFLRDCRRALYVPDAEFVASMHERSTSELLRKAGDRLMDTPAWAANSANGLYRLFESCNIISSLTYEKAETFGGMLIAREGHPNIEPALTLIEPVPLTAYRRVRKLLQMAGRHQRLICDGASILGFGMTRGNYDQSKADLFEVLFTGHYRWELYHAGHGMMRSRYGTPELPLTAINRGKLTSDLKRVFREATSTEIERLVMFAMQACEQRKGAVLIISAQAESESKRLANQSTPIIPVLLTIDLIRHLTEIDGALLVDPHGVCFSVGVILDGIATEHGDPARGARYNSSVRYLVGHDDCVAIIVSEDGTAEWIPDLRPQIKRSEISRIQVEVEALLIADTHDNNRIWKALDWLRNHRFYLPAGLCAVANELVTKERAAREKAGALFVQYPPFEPNPAMSDEYLVD
jgi:DisA bacterial checkpoint controller nucleotide-binding